MSTFASPMRAHGTRPTHTPVQPENPQQLPVEPEMPGADVPAEIPNESDGDADSDSD